ncbi:acetyl-CoA carboxylase biotin carboxylase subunit [Thermospira aquatica]|uniref:Biotin carboxylase n=1 Tax=Thermospira aquatica TaxID=2828656 RepID=A0AAX3BD52_9SPIR|nr:acetyl-CoA carboxylase biotin carboxylase subunit [Thermospira aquatica]URA10038.1 acetyl-CoA carboxylase biotin carboxylase subunit [Thermospira aquatica]
MINKILVTNRGEIAVRVIRAAKELGLKTVAIHSEVDKDSLHTKLADQDVCIGPALSKDSYLNIPAIISAAEITGADAVHPGYGFLSENSKFARICADHNLVFIGPSGDVMDKLGDKATARKTMSEAGVPITPGTGIIKDVAEALKFAHEVGYPVIVKATAGGGGKGMRVAWSDDELSSIFPIAQAEAQTAFGNPDVYVEKYLQNPRHIEIQFIADKHGNVAALFERDCSIQRRHQKLIEEAPSPALPEEIREKMVEAVRRGAAHAGYFGAGTMEFLYDEEAKQFYFMEVNARIQVEHPVTELITGVDLVKEQIRVAMGEKLSFTQEDLKIYGHAIECRINAEDPYMNFMPVPGKIVDLHFPGGPGIRIDSHIYAGYEIPKYYDSLVAKVLAWGRNREEAIARMRRLLDELRIEGIKTTAPFHRQMMDHPDFIRGAYSTKFMENFKMK